MTIKYFNLYISIICLNLFGTALLMAGQPEYSQNPYSFPIQEMVYGDPLLYYIGDQFFTCELDGEAGIDYTFRSETKLYVYDHWGALVWSVPITNPGGNGGAKHGAADVDGDGLTEIVALDASNQVKIFQASNGVLKQTWSITTLKTGQKAGHIVLVNLRGTGTRDAIIQTLDVTGQSEGINYYVNRSLIAMNLETGDTLWQVDQDRNLQDPYEGYWGQGHGPLVCADVDDDGLDEVVGGTAVDDDGTVINLNYEAWPWVQANHSVGYLDHIDAIAVGDFRADLPGLEWIIAEEGSAAGEVYNTVMFSLTEKLFWRKMPLSLKNGTFNCGTGNRCLEPQNITVGNFSTSLSHKETWNSSRFLGTNGDSQHPWLLDADGNLIAHYRTDETLPAGFRTAPNGNAEGLEMVWTIDWDGSAKEYIAGQARHTKGNAGVFDAMDGTAVWVTGREFPAIRSLFCYVADVSGDSREEVIVCDSTSSGPVIRIYQNDAAPAAVDLVDKWDIPLYTRLKQNWNYYSPGSYTQSEDVALTVRCILEGAWQPGSQNMRTALRISQYLPATSPYAQDPRSVSPLPFDMTDWILLEIVNSTDDAIVAQRSLILKNDGYCRHLGSDTLRFGIPQGAYYIQLTHQNHLTTRTRVPVELISSQIAAVDFAANTTQMDTSRMVSMTGNRWGIPGGDANGDTLITISDYIQIQSGSNTTGYTALDINRDGMVNSTDLNFVLSNRNRYGWMP